MSPRKYNSKNKSRLFPKFRSKSATKRSKYFKIQIVLISIILIFVAYMVSYWIGNGFSLGDNVIGKQDGFYMNIDSPLNEAVYTQGHTITFSGGSLGGTLRQTIIWNDAYNVGVPCNVIGTQFSVRIPGERLFPGRHTFVVQGQNIDGAWSKTSSVDIIIMPSGDGEDTYVDWGEVPHYAHEPTGLFRPIVDIWDGIVGRAEQGTRFNDFNGDGIDDRLQSSPLSPRHNPLGLPIMLIIFALLIAGIVALIVYYSFNHYKRKEYHRVRVARKISSDKSARDWYLKLASLPLTESKLGEKLSKAERENILLKKDLQSSHAKLAYERSILSSKVARLDERRKNLLQQRQNLINKLRNANTKSLSTYFDPRRHVGINPESKYNALDSRVNAVKKQMSFSEDKNKISEQLAKLNHKMQVYDVEMKKLRARDNLLKHIRDDPKDVKGSSWFARNIEGLKSEQNMLTDVYKYRLDNERIKREQDQKRFRDIVQKLEREKAELKKEKNIRILIEPKSGNRKSVKHQNNRGVDYGRTKKKKSKKKCKSKSTK
jgi:hypothetical protein